jgi:hypothetical protein
MMRPRNTPLIIANVLTILAFFAHTIGGDIELHVIQPEQGTVDWINKQQMWTMARCGWHWISFDLLFASVLLYMINFTQTIEHKRTILQLLAIYFVSYSIIWIFVLLISTPFNGMFVKLGQWALLAVIGGLIFFGMGKESQKKVLA